jgi:hypothetical protein
MRIEARVFSGAKVPPPRWAMKAGQGQAACREGMGFILASGPDPLEVNLHFSVSRARRRFCMGLSPQC